MKKLISIFIAVMTVFCSSFANYAYAAPDFEYFQASEFLSGFLKEGIFDGKDDSGITRGKFVCDVVKLMECEIINDLYISFEDVSDADVYYPYINTAAAYGFISDGNKFWGENMISLSEALKILSCAFDYDQIAQQNGGYPEGYIKTASQRGILDGVVTKEDGTLTNKGAKILVYNFLFDNAIEQDTIKIVNGNKVKYTYKRNKSTNLEKFFDMYETEGIITETSYSSLLLGSSVSDKNKIAIDGVIYNSEVLTEEYLGLNVKAYYRENGSNSKDIFVIVPTDNDELFVDAENFDEISDNTFKYEKDGKEKKASLNPAVVYIYNGRRVNEVDASLFDGDICDIRLLDNSSDGKYDVVFVNSYKYYTVEDVDYSSGVIGLRDYGRVDINPEGKLFCFDTEGNFKDVSSVKSGDVAALKKSPDGELVTLIICSDEVSGIIKEYAPSDNKIVIKDTEYEIVKGLKNVIGTDVSVGKEASFAIGVDGKLVKLKETVKGYKYGYLIYTSSDLGKSKSDMSLRILASDGEFKTFDAADNVYVDNIKVEKRKLSDKLNEIGFSYSIIKYKLDGDGKVKYIDTPVSYADGVTKSEDNSLIKYTYSDTLYYRSSPEVLVPKACISSAVMFYAPKIFSGNEEDLCVVFKGNLVNNKKYTAELYDINEEGMAGAVVFRTDDVKTVWGSQHSSVMVDKITTGINDDGDIVKKLYCWRGGALVCYDVSDDVSLEKSSGKTVSKGDIVRIGIGKNKIERLTPDIDASGSSIIADPKSSGQLNAFTSSFSYAAGYVYSVGVNLIVLSDTPITAADVMPTELNVVPLSTSASFLRYNKSDGTIAPAALRSVHTLKGVGASADYVVIKTASDVGSDVFIYE